MTSFLDAVRYFISILPICRTLPRWKSPEMLIYKRSEQLPKQGDYISVGLLTKNIQAVDLSMRVLFQEQ